MSKFLTFSFLLIFFTNLGLFAQVREPNWSEIDSSILNNRFLEQTHLQLLQIKGRALQSGNDIQLARSLYNLMLVRDRRTEDTLYFRNSAILDTLLETTKSEKLKALLLVMRARRLSNFDHRPLKFNYAAYRSKRLKFDYAALSPKSRDSLANADLNAALHFSGFTEPADQLLWISSDPANFLFPAKFQDIVYAEKVSLASLNGNYENKQQTNAIKWLSLSSANFRKKLDSVSLSPNLKESVFSAYQSWLTFHRDNKETGSFIESLIRKYIFLSNSVDSIDRENYITYLQHGCTSAYPALKVHSIYQLCLIWNEAGNDYAELDYDYPAPAFKNFNVKNQYYLVKALNLFEENEALLYRYNDFYQVLSSMARQIKTVGMIIQIKDHLLPNTDIPIKLLYKNANRLAYRIIQIRSDESTGAATFTADHQLLARRVIAQGEFDLPSPKDYNKHAVFLKLAGLPIGRYRLLFTADEGFREGAPINNISFQVTGLAVVNSDRRVFVLDRKSGYPIVGATVRNFKRKPETEVGKPNVTAKDGSILIGATVDSIQVVYCKDTTGRALNVTGTDQNENLFKKSQYETKSEFYEDQLRVSIFTDRSIYRPGQTVHYKLIFLTKNAGTGEQMLFNPENVSSRLFKTLLDHWRAVGEDRLTLVDPFHNVVDSATVRINDFGTFAGSFVLPKVAKTGTWYLEAEPNTNYENRGEIRVEEYKRPTIAMTLAKQEKMLLPGQKFELNLRLRSLSGAELRNTQILYIVSRKGRIPSASKSNRFGDYTTVQLLNSSGYTDAQGELHIGVLDSLLARTTLDSSETWNYTYEINATAIAGTGERTVIKEQIDISSRPVSIRLPVAETYDRQDLPTLPVGTNANFGGQLNSRVRIRLFKTCKPEASAVPRIPVDQWYYPEASWKTWFPDEEKRASDLNVPSLVLDTIVNTGQRPELHLDKRYVKSGFYELVANCDSSGRTIGASTYRFMVFDSRSDSSQLAPVNHFPKKVAAPGEVIDWFSSGDKDNYTIYQVLYVSKKKKKNAHNIYLPMREKAGIRHWRFRLPEDATGEVVFNRIQVINNDISTWQERVVVNSQADVEPAIVLERYRKVMAPGAKEDFSLSFKTKNPRVAGEMMTTLYDAALDQLEPHTWSMPRTLGLIRSLYSDWSSSVAQIRQAGHGFLVSTWVNFPELRHFDVDLGAALQGRAAGVSILESSGLQEVVVVGYGSKRVLSGAVTKITIRGMSSLPRNKGQMVILDGQVYDGDLNGINMAKVKDVQFLSGGDAVALYGSRAAPGVLIISTTGMINSQVEVEPKIKIRKNFNETAFFFPQVHTSRDGYYHFSFTMPETATEWNWKVLAHTRKSEFAYMQKTLQTQLGLMVTPHMPRLLYQGDLIKLQSLISNLDTILVNGSAKLKIEDLETGADLTALLTSKSTQPFTLERKSTSEVSFSIKVPPDQTNPLRVVISVASGQVTDAEEHIIPVMSSKIFLRKSQSIDFRTSSTISLSPIDLPKDSQFYGFGISIAEKPQAALLHALPWLANYSFDCAEQTFNKLRAEVTALHLMQNDTSAQRSFKLIGASQITVGEKSSSEARLDESASLPWLTLNNRAEKAQKDLIALLDTNYSKPRIKEHLNRLYALQQPDGGLSWFDGGVSDRQISAYILVGFAQLKQNGWQIGTAEHTMFIERLFKYQKSQLAASSLRSDKLLEVYALSSWNKFTPPSSDLKKLMISICIQHWAQVDKLSLTQQALLIIGTLNSTEKGSALCLQAQAQLRSIRENAIEDAENGIRWKAFSDAESLEGSAEETLALISEAFELSGQFKDVHARMLKWLLTARQEEHWTSTKATAAAIHLLTEERQPSFGANAAFSANLGGKQLSVTNNLLQGQPSAFMQLKEAPQTLTITAEDGEPKGSLQWYYFASPSKVDALNKEVKIEKNYYLLLGGKWVLLPVGRILQVGDEVQIRLTIETDRRLTYVHINDPRAAAFEPKQAKSGYEYSKGFSYYQSIRDSRVDLFSEALPRGISEITYQVTVAHAGEFNSGPSVLTCMYQPGISAFSETRRFTIQ